MGLRYDDAIEASLEKIRDLLKDDYLISKRAVGLLLLQGDEGIKSLVREREGENYWAIERIVEETQVRYGHPLSYVIAMRRHREARRIVAHTLTFHSELGLGFGERLSRLMMRPLTGIPILFLVLYLGLYQFVGVFGAQTLVGFLEEVVFGEYVNPYVTWVFTAYVHNASIQELFVGDYGIITLGVRYAVALILPIVGTFFFVFSMLEDTGYFPRLALLIDRVFKKIGLNGRAVIPMVLGFGCSTMATIVTRTLETKREKVISTLLLALAIPCSAQLGVIVGLLSNSLRALVIWGGFVAAVFLIVGFLASKVMPGERPSFYMEVPPLRMPKLSNVTMKTYTRLEWYFLEVFPLFILASILIWIGQITGLFQLIIGGLEPIVATIGLPRETAIAFLFGFFRRDYGVSGLFDLQKAGLLSGLQLLLAAVTLTLFVPCIAQFSVTIKERGLKTTVAIMLFIFPFAFLVGFLLNNMFTLLGVTV